MSNDFVPWIDPTGSLSIDGWLWATAHDTGKNCFLLTNGEKEDSPLPFTIAKTVTIYHNQTTYEHLSEKFRIAKGQCLRIRLTNLHYYKAKGEYRLWFTKHSSFVFLDPEEIIVPRPKIWSIVAQHANGNLELWNGSCGLTRTLEEIRSEHGRVMLDDQSTQWCYNYGIF